MIRSFITAIILLLFIPICSFAQDVDAVIGKTYYSFLIHNPSQQLEQKQPVFVFLHGRSLCGNNLERVKRYGALYAMDKGQDIPGYVVAPQAQAAWDADKVIEVVDYVLKNYPNADPTRVYICGMSLGGYGTMEVAGRYPNRIAAAVAICGGGSSSEALNLTKVPIQLFHGTADRIVPISESRKILRAIKKADPDANVSLKEIKGGTHGSVERLFHNSEIYDWMMRYKKNQAAS